MLPEPVPSQEAQADEPVVGTGAGAGDEERWGEVERAIQYGLLVYALKHDSEG